MAKEPKAKKRATKRAPASGPKEVSWRAINQKGNLRSNSAAARERRMHRLGRTVLIGLAVLVLGGGVGYALYFSGSHLEALIPAPSAAPLTQLDFSSDGVLDEGWFREQFPLPAAGGDSAMDFDVHELKTQLENIGQVRVAKVAISLPETLIVRLEEREPLLRARVRDPEGQVRDVLVAADGVAYQGFNYPLETWQRLPGLTGVRFKWVGERMLPIEAMETVAPLVQQARNEFPELYRQWQWISLEKMSDDPFAPQALISVKSREADRIIFAPRVFSRQLRKLSEVVATARPHQRGFRKIDLSFPDQAIVQTRDL